MNEPFVKELY